MIFFMTSFLLNFIFVAASAFTLNPSSNSDFKGWASNEVNFVINNASCPGSINIDQLMRESFETWNQVPTSRLKLNVTGTSSSTAASNPTVVYCSVNFAADLGFTGTAQEIADFEDSVPGAAILSSSGDFAVSGRLVLNASGGDANVSLFNQTLLKIILAHEVGHIIGLGHSHDSNALMYYNAAAKNTLALSQDDMDGVTYLYPRNELGPDQMMGCGLMRNHLQSFPPNGPGPLTVLMSIVLLLIPISLARRMRNESPQNVSI